MWKFRVVLKGNLNVGGVKDFLLFKLSVVPRLNKVEFLFVPEWPSAVEKLVLRVAELAEKWGGNEIGFGEVDDDVEVVVNEVMFEMAWSF